MKNIIDNLYNDFNFRIIITDREIGDSEHYKNVEIDKWTSLKIEIYFYSSKYKK